MRKVQFEVFKLIQTLKPSLRCLLDHWTYHRVTPIAAPVEPTDLVAEVPVDGSVANLTALRFPEALRTPAAICWQDGIAATPLPGLGQHDWSMPQIFF